MSKYEHFANEIRAANSGITNAALGAAVKARIAKEHPVPTPYEVHGLPDPTDIAISDADRNRAFEIIDKGAPNLLVQYVRNRPPVVGKVILDVKSGETTNKMMRGTPIGVLVAFKDGESILVGYSKYNRATVKIDDLNSPDHGETVMVKGKPVQLEKLVFTKKDAINTAVLRALTDTAELGDIPFKIATDLPAFLTRVEKYFRGLPSNLTNTVGFA